MMTREQMAAAAERCRAAGLAYLAVPGQDDDLPGLLVPGARDKSEWEFTRTTLTLSTLRDVIRQGLARIENADKVVVLGLAAADHPFHQKLWRVLDYRLREGRAALEMALAFLPRTGDGEVEFGASCLGASWGYGVEAALHRVKLAERDVAAVLVRSEGLKVEDDDRERLGELLAALAAGVERGE